jgi:hypothetical protein
LQDAKQGLVFTDYNFLYVMGTLSYYQGRPGDPERSYFGHLNTMRKMAREQIETLQMDKQECRGDDDLLCRAQNGELGAINAIVYCLAEDLARDNAYAFPYRARMEEYANDIKRALDAFDKRETTNGFYANLAYQKYSYLDTYAYAMLVVESGRPTPDNNKLKILVAEFDKVVERFEERAKRLQSHSNADRLRETVYRTSELSALKLARAHRAAARALVGE